MTSVTAGDRVVDLSGASAGLDFAGVSKRFDDGTVALLPTTFSVRPGELVSIVGPSGCGKSTLLRLAAALIAPTTGTITVGAHNLGYVFQDPTLLPWRTVRANAMLLLDVIGRQSEQARVDALLQTVGLSHFANHYPAQLSGGMRQRVALARALALDPEILLMDEPFAALDAITRERLGVELLGIWDGARSVVFVTHSIAEAVLLSDRVVVMSTSPGRIVADITIDIPRPRDGSVRSTDAFKAYEDRLRDLIEGVRA